MTRSIALVLVLVLTGSANAEPGTDAASVFARGQALHARGDYASAIAAFERAYKLKPHHAVLCSIALYYEQMNRFVESAEQYRRCLREGGERSPKATSVKQALKVVETKINYLEVKSPGAGGTVHVNGLAVGPAPQRVPLDPGRHVIEVRRPGATAATATVRLVSGEERSLTLVPTGEQGRAPTAAVPPPEVVSPVSPAAPAPTPTVRRGVGRRRLSPAWFWTSVGLTVALGGAAAMMGGLTYSTASDYDRTPTQQGYNTFIDRRLATNVLAGLALAAAATGTTLFSFTDFSGRRRGDEVAAGVGLRGSF
jgi:hypothetical protein